MKSKPAGFTMIEMLVVMGIVATLAALAVIGLTRSIQNAKAVTCLNNLRQIGSAALQYAAENNGQLPRSQHQSDSWVGSLQTYLGGTNLFRCPTDPNKIRLYSYAINDFLTPNPYGAESLDYSRLQSIPKPSAVLLMTECLKTFAASDHFHFADSEEGGCTPTAFSFQVETARHDSRSNYLFADGHVSALTWAAVTEKLVNTNSQFIKP